MNRIFQQRQDDVPRHLFGRFVEVDSAGRVVVTDERDRSTVHRFAITNPKSPGPDQFTGRKKIGRTDLTLQAGSLLRFDQVSAVGDAAEAAYAKVLSIEPDAFCLLDLPVNIFSFRAKSGEKRGEEYRRGIVVDRRRSVLLKNPAQLERAIGQIAQDGSMARSFDSRHVMLRAVNPAPTEGGVPVVTRVIFAREEDGDAGGFAARALEEAGKEGFAEAISDETPVEITPVLELNVAKYFGGFPDGVVEPERLVMQVEGKPRRGFVTMCVVAKPYRDETGGYSIDYASPRFNPTNEKLMTERLVPMTQVWTPILGGDPM